MPEGNKIRQVVENEKLTLIARVSTVASGAMMTLIVVPLMIWVLTTVQALSVDSAAITEQFKSINTQIEANDRKDLQQDAKLDKLDDRIRNVEITRMRQ